MGIASRIRAKSRTMRKTAFAFVLLLTFFLVWNGIETAHQMGEREQQAVTALEKLVVGIGEDGTVRLVTATLDDQVRSVNRYPLESGVTDLPDSLPVTEQTRIQYPWAVAVSQGKLFVFDLRSIVAENTPCQAVCDRQKLYIAYVDGETASIAIVEFSDGIPPLQIEKGFPKQIAELPYKFAVTSDGIHYLQARREDEERYPTQCLTDNGVTVENMPYIFTGNGRLYGAAFTGLMMKERSAFVKLVPWSRLRNVVWNSWVEPSVQFINDRYLCFESSTELPVYNIRSYYLVVDTKNCTWCTIDQDNHWHDLYDSLYN